MSSVSSVSNPNYSPPSGAASGAPPRTADKPKDGDADDGAAKAASSASSANKVNVLA
jgi:hypothetical protein